MNITFRYNKIAGINNMISLSHTIAKQESKFPLKELSEDGIINTLELISLLVNPYLRRDGNICIDLGELAIEKEDIKSIEEVLKKIVESIYNERDRMVTSVGLGIPGIDC